MRILIVSNNQHEIEELKQMIKTLNDEAIIDESYQLDKASDYYTLNSYDYVFVNYDFTDDKIFSQYLSKEEKNQTLVAISSLFDCHNKFDCKFCKEKKNRYKMMKPITFNDVIKVLTHQKEHEKHYCDDNYLLLKLKKIAKEVDNFSLDTYSHTIVNKNSHLNREKNLNTLLHQLDNSQITYEVDSLKNIKLV